MCDCKCLRGQEAKIMWHTQPATPTSPDAIKHPTEWIAARVLSALIGVQSPHASYVLLCKFIKKFLDTSGRYPTMSAFDYLTGGRTAHPWMRLHCWRPHNFPHVITLCHADPHGVVDRRSRDIPGLRYKYMRSPQLFEAHHRPPARHS